MRHIRIWTYVLSAALLISCNRDPEVAISKNLTDNAIQIFRTLVKEKPNNPIFREHLSQALTQKEGSWRRTHGRQPKARAKFAVCNLAST